MSMAAKPWRLGDPKPSMKGQPCPYKPITCQEGFCADCQIYLDGYRKLNKEEIEVCDKSRNTGDV